MRIRIIKTLTIAVMLVMLGCSQPIEKTARDGIATATGAISNYQAKYHDQCVAAPTGTACVAINRAIVGQNATITALEAYCGFKPGDDLASACKPVATAKDGLQAALNNLQQLVNDLKGLK
jgi:hypothetical protein